MFRRLAPIYKQALIVLNSTEEPSFVGELFDANSTISPFKSMALVTAPSAESIDHEDEIIKTTFSSVPTAWDWELRRDYRELGTALSEMSELSDTDDWRLDVPVFVAACFTASWLLQQGYPAPRVFTHGPKSAVFNWTNGYDNLYLTVSSDRLSALVSQPERITFREDFDMRNSSDLDLPFLALRAALTNGPVKQLMSPLVTSELLLTE